MKNKFLYHKTPSYSVFKGSSLDVLKTLPDESVDTCLTSPPYWSARDYGDAKQIGLEDTLEQYIDSISRVFSEVRRVLRRNGSAWLNIGDCYLHGSVNDGWKRNKQLSLIPFRVAMRLQDDGWLVRNTMVWQKPNAMPSSVRDRLTNTWEPVFLLTKHDDYYFNLDAVRVPHKTSDLPERKRANCISNDGKAKSDSSLRQWLNSPRHRATIDGLREVKRRVNAPSPVELAKYLREFAQKRGMSIKDIAETLNQPHERVRHYFRTDEIGSRLPPEETWLKLKGLLCLDSRFDDAMAIEVGDNVFRNHPNGRNPGDMQSFSIKGDSAGHFAVMPLALAEWMLKSTLPESGVCLDPFMGLGTTGIATLSAGGKFIGVDVRADYMDIFKERVRGLSSDK